MSTAQVKPIPDGMHTVTPHLVCAGASDAIEFYKKAFNAVETARMPGPGGKLMHAAVKVGDSTVMLVDESPEWGMLGPKSLKGTPVTIHLYVENADAFAAQAAKAQRQPASTRVRSSVHSWPARRKPESRRPAAARSQPAAAPDRGRVAGAGWPAAWRATAVWLCARSWARGARACWIVKLARPDRERA